MSEQRGELRTRSDLDALLLAFYQRAMSDDLLGPVFRAAHLDLVTHLPRIGDFWERTLLGSGSYSGQPMEVHRRLHESQPLTPEMFDRWLQLWSTVVDSTRSGPLADQAIAAATRIAAAMQRQLDSGPDLLQITPSRRLP